MINSAVAQSKTKPVLPGDVKVVAGSSNNDSVSGNKIPVVQPPARTEYTPLNLNSSSATATPESYNRPQASVEPIDVPQYVPSEVKLIPELSVSEIKIQNDSVEQPATDPGDKVDSPDVTPKLPAEIAPVNWDETPKE